MSPTRRRLLRLAPLSVLAIGGSAAWVVVEHKRAIENSPMPVALTQTMPRFRVPGLTDGGGFTTDDIAAQGKPVLLNFFASWCGPCIKEAATLLKLRDGGLAIWGIAFKDKPEATQAFLRAHGDPYGRIGRDDDGAASIGFGLTGVPETFLIDKDGDIRWRWAGGLTDDVAANYLTPILRSLV